MELRVFLLALFVYVLAAGPGIAGRQTTAGTAIGQTNAQSAGVIEQAHFEFERANEDRKATIEILKAGLTAASLLIPLLIGVYSIRAQSRAAFELKAAEIVMNARNVFGVRTRANVLRALFPGKLQSGFAQSFDPKEHAVSGPSSESKLELLKLIVAQPEREEEIVRLWRRMYIGDDLKELFPGDFQH